MGYYGTTRCRSPVRGPGGPLDLSGTSDRFDLERALRGSLCGSGSYSDRVTPGGVLSGHDELRFVKFFDEKR